MYTLSYSIPNFKSFSCSVSDSNCHFLTYIQTVQETRKVILYPARSHYGRFHPWQVMRRRLEMQGCSGYKGPSRFTPASTPPCILPVLLLSLFVLLQIFALPDESSPVPLTLNKDHHRTLINKSPGCWFPMKGPGMKEMFQLKPFFWHSGLFGKCVLMHMTAHNTLIMNSIKNLTTQKALIGTEPLGGWKSPIRKHKNIILKWLLDQCFIAVIVLRLCSGNHC